MVLQSFDYDISPILQEIFSLKMGCTTFLYNIWYIAFIESYYFLCVRETIEQIYRNMCLVIRKLFVIAYLRVQNILISSPEPKARR